MLSQAILSDFIKDSIPARSLPSGVLPLNNNPSILTSGNYSTACVVDTDGKTPVAFGIINRCSSKQAYCMLGNIAKKYAKSVVVVEPVKNADETSAQHKMFKVVESFEGRVDKSQWRPYHAVFGEDEYKSLQMVLADELIEMSIGTENMDGAKNITIDIVGAESENLSIWRDESGFVVADACTFGEMTVDREHLAELGKGESEVIITPINKAQLGDVLEFDEQITLYNRASFIEFLFSTQKARGFVGRHQNGETAGYVVALGDRILQCYADEPNVAEKLLAYVARSSETPTLTFFYLKGASAAIEALKENAIDYQKVSRLHTRIRSTQVKWNMVYAVNIGLSIL